MGIASLFMPAIIGVIADRWVNAERLYAVLHILGAASLFLIPQINNPVAFFREFYALHGFLYAHH